jgi:hypothetical protein
MRSGDGVMFQNSPITRDADTKHYQRAVMVFDMEFDPEMEKDDD